MDRVLTAVMNDNYIIALFLNIAVADSIVIMICSSKWKENFCTLTIYIYFYGINVTLSPCHHPIESLTYQT